MRTLWVGNLPIFTSERELKQLFECYGPVKEVTLSRDAETGSLRGFGWVQMPKQAARRAVAALDGRTLGGRELRVRFAGEI